MAGKVPHSVPGTQSSWLPATLAIIVHLALFAFFWIGISWKSDVKLAVEAEIWDMQYKDAAPLPEPVSEPELQIQEQPQPEPAPVVAPPEPKVEPPPVENPEIALEKERKKKEEQRKEELRKEAEKQELLKKQEAEKLAQQKAEQDKKKADEQKKADDLAKKQAAEDKKKAEADAKKKAAEAKASEARRQAEVQRMMSQAGGTGTAEKSQGPRGASNYASKVAVRIRSNTIFDVPANLSGNPAVEYTVDLMPDGSVRNSRKTKSSGVPGFDEAVANAIDKSQPFPRDVDGKVPSTINIIHRPKDQ
jgi:colicin import membrane protein